MSSLPTHERQMAATGPAYLVIRNGSRWTDVYRLEPEKPVIIGRASNCQIVIADDRCSRKHAEIFYRGGHWLVRDLGSRNGTAVDQQTIGGEHALQVGQSVVVAGCQMVYVKDVAQAFSSGMALPGDSDSDHDRDPQRTEDEHSPALITHRQHRADLLADGQGAPDRAAAIARLAFQLAQSADLSDAAGHALDIALARTGARQGAVLAIPEELRSKSDSLTTPPTVSVAHLHVLAAKHDSGRSYHRLPDLIASTVCGGGEAVLARNLRNDESLVRQDSRGQLNTSSTLAAPIRSGNQILGLIHLYSNLHESDLQPDHLEFVLAVADLLGAAWNSLGRQAELTKRLDRSRRRVEQLKAQLNDQQKIIGKSPAIEAIRLAISRVGPTQATVLVRGESGTGKELVAAAIHEASTRRDGPLICLNCAALSPTLLESELFGHEKGAFTGATDRKIGKFEAADGGTLMLDEIGEMALDIQAKFLRVLEGHPFERLGGNQAIRADVRVVAATNRDLEQAVREQRFRADLYYRLHVVELTLPPLRQRANDVLMIAEVFAVRFGQQMGRRITGFTQAAIDKLQRHSWPGNVRELKNVIERAVVLGNQTAIDAEDLLLSDLRLNVSEPSVGTATVVDDGMISLAELENRHIQRVLDATGGHKSRAAAILGIERSTLDRKLKKQ